ncbi:hypothetical protein [Actinoallomurus sp. CA-150999]|uniref:hypothetical protein n=1 Tax=Actinoallomurus sp. CA-150999 TaxID=3239887 RepID=UPI003D8C47C3
MYKQEIAPNPNKDEDDNSAQARLLNQDATPDNAVPGTPLRQSVLTAAPTANAAKATGKRPATGLTLNGKRVSITDTQAIKTFGTTLNPPADEQKGQMRLKLLKNIVAAANQSKKEMFTEVNVRTAYGAIIAEAAGAVAEAGKARADCTSILNSPANRQMAQKLDQMHKQQKELLDKSAGRADIPADGHVIVLRGTGARQARAIMTEGTFGGRKFTQDNPKAPSPEDGVAQTGLNDKNASGGLIEEWSLIPQTGFASMGFMLIAEAAVAKVNLPEVGANRVRGECGVVGYADQKLIEVAILWAGSARPADESDTELEHLIKRLNQSGDGYLKALRKAAD